MRRPFVWLAGCIAGLVVPKAHAQHLDTVIVTVPFNKPQDQSPVPVTVLSGDDLQQRAAGTIGETLSSSPGLTSASFGPGVGQPVIRGQSGPRVQTLINGTTSADASGVSADHATAVEPMLAESIEVLRGPSTLLYGGGAIGGIVNVIDNRIPQKLPERTSGAVEMRHDSVNDGNTSVAKLDGSAGQLAFHIDGVYREWNNIDIPGLAINRNVFDADHSSRGYIDNSAGRNHTVTGGLSWIGDDGYIGFSISDMSNYYGIPPGGEHEEDAEEEEGHGHDGIHIDMNQKRYDLAAEKRDLSDTIDALRWHLTYSDYQHKEIEESGVVGTTFTNETWENRFEVQHAPLAGWAGVIGLQLKRSDFAAIGDESFVPESISSGAGLFVLEHYQLGAFTYQLGARYDRDGVDPDGSALSRKTFDNVSGSASVLWTIDPQWNLGLALSRSQRAPAVEELFSNATNTPGDLVTHEATHSIEVGDSDLKEETSHNIDLTLHYSGDFAHGYVTLFHNDFRDYIALVDSGLEQDGTPILNYTQRDARFQGVEFELNLPIADNVNGKWSVDLYGDRTQGEFSGGENVPRLPPLRIGTRLKFERGPIDAYAGVLHAADQNDLGAFETDTDGYNRVDAGISYQFKSGDTLGALVFMRATNLTNETIRNSVSLLKDVAPEPGRSIETGVRFTF